MIQKKIPVKVNNFNKEASAFKKRLEMHQEHENREALSIRTLLTRPRYLLGYGNGVKRR